MDRLVFLKSNYYLWPIKPCLTNIKVERERVAIKVTKYDERITTTKVNNDIVLSKKFE